jgi:hypothetical protein
MNIICPICGNEDTIPFMDSKLKTQGYHCNHCNQDFGVDDNQKLAQYEKELTDFYYRYQDKDGLIKEVIIKKVLDKVTLTPNIIKNGYLEPSEPYDISDMWTKLTQLFFQELYLLDWPSTLAGIVTGKDESYKVELKFSLDLIPTITKEGTNKFPPYFKVLKQLFESFFTTEGKTNGEHK